jgi:hypothetical protein
MDRGSILLAGSHLTSNKLGPREMEMKLISWSQADGAFSASWSTSLGL